MSKNCVIIPVRGGSVRLPKKNIKSLNGVPLFVHSINYAKENLDICHEIFVSTDSEEIKEIAIKERVKVIDRPKKLSGNLTPTKDVLKHVVKQIDKKINNVILLQATNPLRRKGLLKEAMSQFVKGDFDSLMTVSRNKQKFGKIYNNKFIPFNYKYGQRSQDLEPIYYENGLLYISKRELVESGEIIGKLNFPFIENHVFSKIDIDDIEDFELAEYYFNKYKK